MAPLLFFLLTRSHAQQLEQLDGHSSKSVSIAGSLYGIQVESWNRTGICDNAAGTHYHAVPLVGEVGSGACGWVAKWE